MYTSGSLTGTYAEEALCRVEQVHALPDAIGFAAGAALGVPYATAYRALFQRGQAARASWCWSTAPVAAWAWPRCSSPSAPASRCTARPAPRPAAGWSPRRAPPRCVDHTAPGRRPSCSPLTGGRGYDVIVEMAAHAGLAVDLGLLARGGRVVVVGSRGPVEIAPRELMSRDADVRGMLLFVAPPAALAEVHAAVGEGLGGGLLRPLVGRELPLADAASAHREIVAGPAVGKLVLAP